MRDLMSSERAGADDAVPSELDHLVYATPDLEPTVADLEARLGVCFVTGGVHPAWRTRNALLPLSETSYLEVIGPDPATSSDARPTLFGIDGLSSARLVTWAAKGIDLKHLVLAMRARGQEFGAVVQGSRLNADGARLSWVLTDPFANRAGGVLPFFIEWRGSSHPASVAAPGATLVSLFAEHPSPDEVQQPLHALDIALAVNVGPAPRLRALLRTPNGLLELT
jgi:hypothetical protein